MRFHEQFRAGHLRAWTQQLALLSLLMLAPAAWAGSKYKVLYAFKGGNDGIGPQGNLVFDPAGNLYGTTTEGGGNTNCNGANKGCGTVFQLLPQASGHWKESVLYSFPNGASEGVGLNGNLVFDPAGNLYGTAFYGGAGFTGTVFELTSGSGGWTEKDIYTFCPAGCSDGSNPGTGVIFDDAGNLYGTTAQGGTGGGVIFKLAPGGGSWTESVLHNFCAYHGCPGGFLPVGLIRSASGDLYGVAAWGGNFFWPCTPGDGCGAVFELSPKSGGGWDYNVLHRFTGRDGAFANSGVILDQQGNVYGTTTNDGAFGCGAVFELSPKTGGGWTYNTLYNLRGGLSAGPLAMDPSGNLYVANSGIMSGSCRGPADGEVFKLSPRAHGHWKYSSVHKLNGGQGGGTASSGLIFDKQGNLYGTASAEGAYGYGVVFELTP